MEAIKAPRKKRWGLRIGLLFVGLVTVFLGLPYLMPPRGNPMLNQCFINLVAINAAKEEWALEHKKKAGDPVTAEDEKAINGYLQAGVPRCPSGDASVRYVYGPVGTPPKCTYNRDGEVHTIEAAQNMPRTD